MALDFPSSPANGATYNGYTYDDTKKVWTVSSSTITNMTVSDVAPSNPLSGDAWFDSTTGYVFVYYTDANSSQWVQTTGSYIDTALTNRVATIENTRPTSYNYILNSGFDIWQRGTSGTPTSAATRYVADRWESFRTTFGTGLTVSRQTTGDTTNLPQIQYCARVQRTASNASTSVIYHCQALESVNSIPLAGKTVTLSFYARAGSNYSSASNALSVSVQTGTGTDQPLGAATPIGTFATGAASPISQTATLTTSWQRFSYTGVIAATATQVGVRFNYTPVGTAGTNDYFEVTGVQLEEASVAMPYRRQAPSYQAELLACQRYYCQVWNASTDFELPLNRTSGTNGTISVWLPASLRTAPTLVATASGGAYGRMVMIFTDWSVLTQNITGLSLLSQAVSNQASLYVTYASQGSGWVWNSFDTFGVASSCGLSAEL